MKIFSTTAALAAASVHLVAMAQHSHADMSGNKASAAPEMPAPTQGKKKGSEMGDDMAMGYDMQSALGPYSMTRAGSGTSWQPEATTMEGWMGMSGDWMLMAHGFVNAIYDRQSGPRGDKKGFAESMGMVMAQRKAGPGTLGLRAMVSLDPAATGRSGYPLLFQTGETADGVNPLIDRQHPHDFFMELSGSYSLRFGSDGAVFAYVGLPGEPALGPAAFMHRFSGMRNPEAPLTHHWLDSTHITFGVATLGVSKGPWKLEASSFNGREPDQKRWNIETRGFDSWSARATFNPTPQWSMQVSYGDLKSPEQLEPDMRIKRTTASVSYHAATAVGPWQTTLAWGQNQKQSPSGSERLPGWLAETTLVAHERHTFFGRLEQVRNDELFHDGEALAGQAFRVRKVSAGYIYDFFKTGKVSWGVGGLVGIYSAPGALEPFYGKRPTSAMVFLQGRL
ncbi:MAG: hypothetical protein EKK53_14320 [Burkholderiales bacterium]|nr:MAG: hypothetical protein EKK53_14320 [Burkholderiales bacterium]